MKRTLIVLALLAFVALAGDFATGGAELTKFKGYGTFRWTSFGIENADPSNQFTDYVWMAWLPKINDNVDFCISAKHAQTTGFEFDAMYLNMQLTSNFSIRGGQMKLPFGYAFTRSGGSMLFANRSMITSGDFGTYGGYDIGAQATVELAPVTVDLMFSNGTGSNVNADTTINKQFTARLAVDPSEWLTIGSSIAMIGAPELEDTTGTTTTESWSSNGMDFFAVANYPVSPTGTLNFVGEYMILGTDGVQVDGMEYHDGACMSVMLGYDMQLDGDVVLAVQPAVRYDSVDPISSKIEGADDVEDNTTAIDFCVGIDLFSNLNTLQIGARQYGFEADVDGYMDFYTNWRMNF